MNRYASKDYKASPKGSFVERYAAISTKAPETKKIDEKAEFEVGMTKGAMRFAVASRHMNLKDAGLDMYLDQDTMVVWKKEGDNISRIDNDLSWVDTLLEQEGTK